MQKAAPSLFIMLITAVFHFGGRFRFWLTWVSGDESSASFLLMNYLQLCSKEIFSPNEKILLSDVLNFSHDVT